MTELNTNFERVLSKYFQRRNHKVDDRAWIYKNNCPVAYCYDSNVMCYFKIDEDCILSGGLFNTLSVGEMYVYTTEDLEIEIQRFLVREKEVMKKLRRKYIDAL